VYGQWHVCNTESHLPHIHMLSSFWIVAAANRLREDAPVLNACRCSAAQKDSDALVSEEIVPIHRVNKARISSAIQSLASPCAF